MANRFYIHQFDTVWSFPESGFWTLLEVGARAGRYNLDDPQYRGHRLAGQFACGRFNDSTGARTLRVPRRFQDAYFISPPDWSEEEFKEELERFLKKKREPAISKRITLHPFTRQMPEGFRTRRCKAPVIVFGDNGAPPAQPANRVGAMHQLQNKWMGRRQGLRARAEYRAALALANR
jgi:hypothetical protein